MERRWRGGRSRRTKAVGLRGGKCAWGAFKNKKRKRNENKNDDKSNKTESVRKKKRERGREKREREKGKKKEKENVSCWSFLRGEKAGGGNLLRDS